MRGFVLFICWIFARQPDSKQVFVLIFFIFRSLFKMWLRGIENDANDRLFLKR
jgi:hypothetical protein